VERNRLKRRLREIGRRVILPAAAARARSVDILIRARRRGYDAGFDELMQEVMDAVEALW
jgi:ribonuclease P protein component